MNERNENSICIQSVDHIQHSGLEDPSKCTAAERAGNAFGEFGEVCLNFTVVELGSVLRPDICLNNPF